MHGRVATNDSEAVLHMVRRGLAIALVADWLIQEPPNQGLIELLEDYTSPTAPIIAHIARTLHDTRRCAC